jgi:GntR family transcriptional regulator
MSDRAAQVLRVDPGSPVPVYRQIVDGLRALLVAGTFAPGDQLPTVRQVAEDLGVHHNTVAGAYRELADEGWLELRRRSGATVLPRDTPRPSKQSRERFVQRLRELVAKARADGVPAEALREAIEAVDLELREVSP